MEAKILYVDDKIVEYQIPFSSGRLSWYQLLIPLFSFKETELLSRFNERIIYPHVQPH